MAGAGRKRRRRSKSFGPSKRKKSALKINDESEEQLKKTKAENLSTYPASKLKVNDGSEQQLKKTRNETITKIPSTSSASILQVNDESVKQLRTRNETKTETSNLNPAELCIFDIVKVIAISVLKEKNMRKGFSGLKEKRRRRRRSFPVKKKVRWSDLMEDRETENIAKPVQQSENIVGSVQKSEIRIKSMSEFEKIAGSVEQSENTAESVQQSEIIAESVEQSENTAESVQQSEIIAESVQQSENTTESVQQSEIVAESVQQSHIDESIEKTENIRGMKATLSNIIKPISVEEAENTTESTTVLKVKKKVRWSDLMEDRETENIVGSVQQSDIDESIDERENIRRLKALSLSDDDIQPISVEQSHIARSVEETENTTESVKEISLSDDILKRISLECFERLRQIIKNGLNHTMRSARKEFTVDDFRTGCKYYDFEHVHHNSH